MEAAAAMAVLVAVLVLVAMVWVLVLVGVLPVKKIMVLLGAAVLTVLKVVMMAL
jgi:hypothetical protein